MPTLRQLNSPTPPSELLDYIQSALSLPGQRMRCRCILNTATDAKWRLLSCAVEAFPDRLRTPEPVESRRYADCVLYEEWFDLEACRTFISQIQSGRLLFKDIEVLRSLPAPHWHWERVTLRNFYMSAAGSVAHTRYEQNVHILQEPLISVAAPYYPDGMEAAHDWLGQGNDGKYTDGRNGEIVFLLPENRAFFSDLVSDNGTLNIKVDGTHRHIEGLKVTGAYWQERRIQHFSAPVRSGLAVISMPDGLSRLECVLIDEAGSIYDRYFEHAEWHSGLIRHRATENDDRLRALVANARRRGEGENVEFKPFIHGGEALGQNQQKTKYRELVRTIVAFANAKGGCVFMGIDDHCGVIGIEQELAKFEKVAPSDEAIAAYNGSLLNKVCGDVEGEIRLEVSPVEIYDHTIVVIEVEEAGRKPLMVRGEKPYYLRVGATNKQVPANEWADHLTSSAGQYIRSQEV